MNINQFNLSQRVIDTAENHGHTILNAIPEMKVLGTAHHYDYSVWLEIYHEGENKTFLVTSDADVFYSADKGGIEKDIERIKKNNEYNARLLQENITRQEKEGKITSWLKDTFGDTLPDRNCIATIRRYMNEDDLLDCAKGRKGVNGMRADAAFFKTKAYKRFYAAIK